MKNIKVDIKGNIMTLTVDLSKRFGLSTSGKTVQVATTGGNAKIDGHDGVQFGLNVYAKPDAAAGTKAKDKAA